MNGGEYIDKSKAEKDIREYLEQVQACQEKGWPHDVVRRNYWDAVCIGIASVLAPIHVTEHPEKYGSD